MTGPPVPKGVFRWNFLALALLLLAGMAYSLHGLSFPVSNDSVGDLLAVRLWAETQSLWLTGLPTSVSGIRQGALWRIYLLFLDGFGLNLVQVAQVSALLSLGAMLMLAVVGARLGQPTAGRVAAVALFYVWATSLESSIPLNPCLVLPLATGLVAAGCLAVARPGPRHHLLLGLMAALVVQVHPAALPLALAALCLPLAVPGPYPLLAGLLPPLAALASLLSLSKSAFLGAWVLEVGPGVAASDKALSLGAFSALLGAGVFLGLAWRVLPAAHPLRQRRETAALFWLTVAPLFAFWLLTALSGRAGEMRYLLAFAPAPVLLTALLLGAHVKSRFSASPLFSRHARLAALVGWLLLVLLVFSGAQQRRGEFQELPQLLRYADVEAILPHLTEAGIRNPREALCRLRSPDFGMYVHGVAALVHGHFPNRLLCDQAGDKEAVFVIRSGKRPPQTLPPGVVALQTGRETWTYITRNRVAGRTLPFEIRVLPPTQGESSGFVAARPLYPGRLEGPANMDIVPLLADATSLGIRYREGPIRLQLKLRLEPDPHSDGNILMVAPPWQLSASAEGAPLASLAVSPDLEAVFVSRDIDRPRGLAPYEVLPFVAELPPEHAPLFREVLDGVR